MHCKLLLRKLGETSSAHLHLQQVEFFRFSPAKVYKRTHIIESRWFLLHQHPLWEDSHTQATFSSHRYEMALEPLRIIWSASVGPRLLKHVFPLTSSLRHNLQFNGELWLVFCPSYRPATIFTMLQKLSKCEVKDHWNSRI